VRITAAFAQNAALLDPTTVALTVKLPNATLVTYGYPATIMRDSLGAYHVDIQPTLSGIWRYGWTSTGTGAGYEESWFSVRVKRVA